MLTVDIKQKFIHWTTSGRLNNHCNNKDFGKKRRRMAPGFLHTSGIKAWSTIFIWTAHTRELYMAVLVIEWRISQRLKEPDTMTWDQVMDHFL